jgi:hypothetical protein
MTTMIEKMARAMVAAEQEQWDLPAAEWDRETLELHGLINLARAALEAIRVPSAHVHNAGAFGEGQSKPPELVIGDEGGILQLKWRCANPSLMFRDMIDAILAEK